VLDRPCFVGWQLKASEGDSSSRRYALVAVMILVVTRRAGKPRLVMKLITSSTSATNIATRPTPGGAVGVGAPGLIAKREPRNSTRYPAQRDVPPVFFTRPSLRLFPRK
jgi:hypothetical protein